MICVELAKDWFEELIRESGHYDHQVHFFFSPHNLNKPKLVYQKTEENKHHNKDILSWVNLSMEEEKKQSSKVSNFMRTVGNMGSAVDYRVITILDAWGTETRRVTLKESDKMRKKTETQ